MLTRFLTGAISSRSRLFLAIFAIVAVFVAFPLDGAAQEPPSAVFTGVGFIDDRPVEDGTIVETWVRGRPVAATEIFNQGFTLHVPEPTRASFAGEVVRFKLNGLETEAAADWFDGTETWVLLYAYTGQRDAGVDRIGDTERRDLITIRELRTRLLELEEEHAEFAVRFDRRLEIDIADATNRWEGAIAELRSEVVWDIQQLTNDFEFEAKLILVGTRRAGGLSSLKAELDAIIEEKWAWFESESRLKKQYLRDEIIELEQSKDYELNNLSQLIYEVETELRIRLENVGVRFEDFWETGVIESPVIEVASYPDRPPDEEADLPIPAEIPVPEEPGQSRGFFFNSISANPNGINRTLDPTALAVIGILITLAATGVQLLKGN